MGATTWIWLTITILFVLVCVLCGYMIKHRKKNCPADHYSFFLMGLVWVPVGFALDNYFLSALGFVLMVFGLIHKSEWKKNRHCWGKIDAKTRRVVVGLATLVGALVFFGFVILYLMMQGYI
ncbi:MAG: hypothetical protein V1729_04210 [Candidatus Woesearchaeota archaeon]